MSEELQKLHAMEQSINAHAMQRQHIHAQLLETKSALTELKNTKKSYKIISNIMVEQDAQELTNNLKDKEERLSARLESVKKQEVGLREEAEKLQKKLVASEEQ